MYSYFQFNSKAKKKKSFHTHNLHVILLQINGFPLHVLSEALKGAII